MYDLSLRSPDRNAGAVFMRILRAPCACGDQSQLLGITAEAVERDGHLLQGGDSEAGERVSLECVAVLV
jgi:hypothetical protein